eukprot:TRINITY_DN19787_c0_g1_i1.p1 TRINITY_DN19787_c0_g1~~TRINITY_DN19787_c0_g1_i1.p1  ORF type:complete len:238 (-),score=55.46 TRINITY_DN19787_c0_g1_i1:8-721(-)
MTRPTLLLCTLLSCSVVALFIVATSSSSPADITVIPTLTPDVPLEYQSMDVFSAMAFRLENLQTRSFYEVRINYPALNPALFEVTWMVGPEAAALTSVKSMEHELASERSLLDTEKTMFRTDERGLITSLPTPSEGESYYVIVSVRREGVARSEEAFSRPIVFHIVLETLFFGAPYDALKIGAVFVFVIVFFAIFGFNWLRHIPVAHVLVEDGSGLIPHAPSSPPATAKFHKGSKSE